jgi:hypothetical protein
MKITIVGSMAFYEKIKIIKQTLENQGHAVIIPLPDEYYEKSNKVKKDSMEDFNRNLKKSDAILVANYKKHDIENYIGVNSLMEIGMAFNRKKKIFILNSIPDNCKDEFQAIGVIVLNADLSKIK